MPSFDIVSEITMHEVRNAVENANRVLSTRYDFRGVEAVIELNEKSETVKVPGMWGETGMTGSLQYRIGDGACRRSVVIPAGWKGRPLKLKLGAVDDLDWVFWNGKLIGHTGEKTPNYWMVSREYAIPEDGTNFGGANELVIIVRNLRDDGGIWKAPIEITGSASGRFLPAGGGSMAAPCGGATSLVVP